MDWRYILWGLHIVLAIWATIDLFRNPRFSGIFRVMLLLVIIFFILIGPAMYALLRDAEPKDTLTKR